MSTKPIVILGIESSCDDTAAAVIQNTTILSNVIAGQAVHQAYGGVVPELASRAHQQNIVPVIDLALKNANIQKKDLDAIAFTRGPGLLGSLLVGSSFAKAMAMSLRIPLIEINHMHAHILAHFIKTADQESSHPEFPFLCLTVSGGHTQIVKVNSYFDMEILGETTDDAAGEAFDKVAKVLQLPYPGGPLVDKLAKEGNPRAFKFPEPEMPDYNYSFSGLKTSFLNFINVNIQKDPAFIEKNLNDICASIQYTIIKILLKKLDKAVKETRINQVAIAGGVSANSALRKILEERKYDAGWKIYVPKFEFCTDNAAMIAVAGYFKFLNHEFSSQNVAATARLEFQRVSG